MEANSTGGQGSCRAVAPGGGGGGGGGGSWKYWSRLISVH